MKVIEKIGEAANGECRTVFSFEFFPLEDRRMRGESLRENGFVACNSSYYDVTRGAGGYTPDLDVAKRMH